jgi:hypothetical protein
MSFLAEGRGQASGKLHYKKMPPTQLTAQLI